MLYFIKQYVKKGTIKIALKSTERTLRRCMRRLIREKNLKNITVSDICEMAEIAKRTFYRYYPDKYALFEDTYLHEFYKKLDIPEDAFIYDIFERIISQMYTEQDFFFHAITSKGQNGFWELMTNLILPHAERWTTSDPYIDRAKDYYIRTDIRVSLHLIEEWIMGGYKETPAELSEFIRLCDAVHGKWQYQLAMRHQLDPYSLERFKNNEW